MKKIFFCLILFSTSLFVTAQSNYDVQHYKYGIQLNDNNDTIYCSAEVSVKFLEPSSSVIFDLALLNKTGKGMLVDSVYGTDILGFSKGEQNILIVTKKNIKLVMQQLLQFYIMVFLLMDLSFQKINTITALSLQTTGRTVHTTGFCVKMIRQIKHQLNLL